MPDLESPIELNSEKPLSWSKRNGFPDWLIAFFWLIIAFVFFQLVANVLALIFIVAKTGFPDDPTKLLNLITENLRWVFVGNSIGQVGILGLFTIYFSRIVVSKEERRQFFRIKKTENLGRSLLLSSFLIVTIQPTIWWLGHLNLQFPFSESYLAFENQQMQVLIDFLTSEPSLLFILFNVAVVPAICEEILFRGFVFRLFSNSAGIIWGIVISGFLFGLYHLKLTQLIPLSLIGMLLAWLTVQSGSLYPAILAHFINNGGSVVAAYYFPDYAFSVGEEFLPPVWMIGLSLVLTLFWLILLRRTTTKGGSHVL
jgi:membrane protease YdiL (CAAX protease family)